MSAIIKNTPPKKLLDMVDKNVIPVTHLIDHTLLKPNATQEQIKQICREAVQYNFVSVCINPTHVPLAADLLKDFKVQICSVGGFSLGAALTSVKAFETRQVIAAGANEVDMVINIGALKDGRDKLVLEDITAVVEVAHEAEALCKVIIETGLLTDEEKVRASQLVQQAGADFVKTSTGFGYGGATVEDVHLMRRTVGLEMGVKAAGGVRGFEDARQMIAAGATRLGASSGVKIAQEAQAAYQKL